MTIIILSCEDGYLIKRDGTKEEVKSVRTISFTTVTAFGNPIAKAFGKLIQITMNGTYSVEVAPNTVLLSGLPQPETVRFFPVFKYNTQEVIGLLQINDSGQLVTYVGNTRNIHTAIYSIEYIAK